MRGVIALCRDFVISVARLRTVAVAMSILIAAASLAQAQVVDWANTTGTPNPWYHVDSNWAGGVAPGSTDTANFNQAATNEVWWNSTTASTTPEVEYLTLLDGDTTFLNSDGSAQHELTILGSGGAGNFPDLSISGTSTTLTNQGLHLHSLGGAQLINDATLTLDGSHAQGTQLSVDGTVGFQVDGNLNVEAGSLVSSTLGFVGRDPSSTGVATVTGSGSQWNADFLPVGLFGDGTLNISAGGLVSNKSGYLGYIPGSTGTANVTGNDSQWNNSHSLFLGGSEFSDGGIGAMNLLETGQVNVGNDRYMKSAAALTVSDFGSNGNLWIRNGSMVINSGIGYLGYSSGSTGMATVTGSGSQWNNSSDLYVGRLGNGTLNVEAGGVVSNKFGGIGVGSGSTGVATVTGLGSQWNNSSDLYVGWSGQGMLNVEAGGVVSNTSGFIGNSIGSIGVATVTGSGSQWNNSSILDVGSSENGTLNVVAGGVVSNTSGVIGNGSGSTGVATVIGLSSQWNNSSVLFVGRWGNGTLNVEAGGLVSNTIGYVSSKNGSAGVATVTGLDSKWNSSGGLFLGGTETTDGGMATLNIEDSGRVNVGNDLYSKNSTALTVSDTGTNGNLWIRNGSTITNSGNNYIGYSSDSTGVANVTGTNSQWNNSGGLFAGYLGHGTLNIEDGGQVSGSYASIGNRPGATGVVNVIGSGSLLQLSGTMWVGIDGDGTLNIEAGGVVNNQHHGAIGRYISSGTVTVTGSGSQWNNFDSLTVGYYREGALNIEAGGLVSNVATGIVGRTSSSTGMVTVTGNGSHWENDSDLQIGRGGQGTLYVEAGGLVTNLDGFVASGDDSVGTATVTGSGSRWNSSGDLYVGGSGYGTLTVEAGGLVSNRYGYIGLSSYGISTATVTGSGSQWNNSSLYIGGIDTVAGGVGTLNVQDNSLVNALSKIKIWGDGTLNLDGGTVRAGRLDPTAYGTFNWTAGTLVVNSFEEDLTQNAGTLVVGNLENTTFIDGSYSLSGAGSLEIELFGAGGVAGADFDLLEIAHNATLGGTLDISLQSGFTPSAGDSFEILTALGVIGNFDTINVPVLPDDLLWFVNYGATSVELITTHAADFDEDGIVSDNDFAIWKSSFGTSPVNHGGGDANADTLADGYDFLTWQRQFANGGAASAATAMVVPEPTSELLLVLAAVIVMLQYRNRHLSVSGISDCFSNSR